MARDEAEQPAIVIGRTAYIMKFPPPLSALPIVASTSRRPHLAIASTAQVPPAALASLFVGISLAPLLVGQVTFVMGPVLMPLGRPSGFVLLRGGNGVGSGDA
ncbi:hypothetical protein EUGRSUZ_E04284 [Eucalyptus grandis]|uniref:Uncharacterized protein n=2 Tax=Eucalyptus grandis TaxID=71139 RepID=A0ACC3L236_EUCGR|nr:hypothetical protein EUGRSUZ_E04284 [Eucalyptus grandis]